MRDKPKIILLGVSFDTGNLGVRALTESSVKLLLNRWPNHEIIFAGSGYEPKIEDAVIGAEQKEIVNVPVRFSKNVFHKCHFLRFLFYGILRKLGFKTVGNEYFKIINDCDFVCDITGGDSFSDIYGFKRFFLGFLTKWLFIFLGKDLIMLPQTYGPFKKKTAKKMAAYILKKAKAVYSRDKNGIECVHKLLRGCDADKVTLCPDVAFILDTRRPKKISIGIFEEIRKKGTAVVGLNVSGLLYNGGYTRDNMFGLKVDYRELVDRIIELLLSYKNTIVLLVPHVFVSFGAVESDTEACQVVYDKLLPEYQRKTMMVEGDFGDQEIRHIIGQCDFFLGSRMHSCIAALSQCVPAVGLAYSDKFEGVFETVQSDQYVLDMRCHKKDEILKVVFNAFEKRTVIRKNLQRIIPGIQSKVMNLFEDINV